jgi:glycosyltransferase involved in cell wall biosynthesis
VASLARAAWIVPNPVRQIFFSPCKPKDSLPSIPIVLNIGEITPRKRQVEVLKLAARLRQRGAVFRLDFVGDGQEQTAYGAQFRDLVSRAQQEGSARCLGLRTASQLVALMDQADGLIHFPKEEAFGLAVAEGLARNLKLFASRVGGIIDIVEGVEGAELFEPEDTGGMEEAIFKWLAGKGSKIENGTKEMARRYHPRIIAQKHLEIYREVLASSRRNNIQPPLASSK